MLSYNIFYVICKYMNLILRYLKNLYLITIPKPSSDTYYVLGKLVTSGKQLERYKECRRVTIGTIEEIDGGMKKS